MTKYPITSRYLQSSLDYLGFPITSRSLRFLNCVSCTLSSIKFSLSSLIVSNLEFLLNLSIVIESKLKQARTQIIEKIKASIYLTKHQNEFIEFGQSLLDGEI